jgi:hypothetical protein
MTKGWLCLAICLAAAPVAAQSNIVLTGAEVGRGGSSAYLGTVLPLSDNPDKGWVHRYWLDYTAYRYQKTPEQRINAQQMGIEAALGFHDRSKNGWGNLYLGGRYGKTHLRPDDPDNDSQGDDFRIKLQLEGERSLSDTWHINGIASHLIGQSSYWMRLRVHTVLDNQRLIGPEFVSQGDRTYRLHKLGLFVGIMKLKQDHALTLKVGASQLGSEPIGAYAGAEWFIPY